jgi:hypothetical protein
MKTALAVLLLAAASSASAGDHKGHKGQKGGADPMRQACGADVDRLCPGAKNPGMCLHEHWDEVSEGCKSFKEGMKKQWQEKQGGKHAGKSDPWREHCGADMDRLCADASDKGACLHQNWGEVSDGCKAFKEGQKRRWMEKNAPQGKDGKGKHVSFENGMKPGGDKPKGKMKFEWTQGEPKPQADDAE